MKPKNHVRFLASESDERALVPCGVNTHTIFKHSQQPNFRDFQWSAYFRQAELDFVCNK